MNDKVMSPLTVRAYRETDYIFDVKGVTVTLKIGTLNTDLQNIMKEGGLFSASVLTAYNPHSIVQSDFVNQTNQISLLHDLKAERFLIFEGEGRHPLGGCEPEPSFLIFSPSLHLSEQLADKYGQNAFLYVQNPSGLIDLHSRVPMRLLTENELNEWKKEIPIELHPLLSEKSLYDQSLIASLPLEDQQHWLKKSSDWDINNHWPIINPQGSMIGSGTELDRMFRIQAGSVSSYFEIIL